MQVCKYASIQTKQTNKQTKQTNQQTAQMGAQMSAHVSTQLSAQVSAQAASKADYSRPRPKHSDIRGATSISDAFIKCVVCSMQSQIETKEKD